MNIRNVLKNIRICFVLVGVAGRKEELYAALKENGCGDLVYETVNANSLSAFVKEQIAENQDTVPEWLSGLVHVYEQTSVSVRQSAK